MADTNKISCEVVLRREGENEFFCGIGVDTRISKGERETKDHLERDC